MIQQNCQQNYLQFDKYKAPMAIHKMPSTLNKKENGKIQTSTKIWFAKMPSLPQITLNGKYFT